MEKNKTKFKYLMGIWKTLPDYPTKEDVIFELSVYLLKDGRPNGDFTLQTLNSAFGQGWAKTKHGEIVKQLIEDGSFIAQNPEDPKKSKFNLRDKPDYCN
jgi:hypothetical protein